MIESGSGAATAKRPWWRRKRWWALALVVWLVARWTVPWSLEGPAMSCFIAKNTRISMVRNFTNHNGSELFQISRYLMRSGFGLEGVNVVKYEMENKYSQVRLRYKTYFWHRACFPLWVLAETYPTIVVLDVAGQGYWPQHVVAINGEKVDGGNQD